MTRTILLLSAFVLPSLYCRSQDELDLKIQYQPQTNYHETIERRSSTETTYSGSDDVMLKLRNKGVDNPSVSDLHFKRELILKTDSVTSNDTFPLTIEIIEETRNDINTIIPAGVIIYGHASPGNMPTLDSVYAHAKTDTFKMEVMRSLDSTFSELALPKKNLRVGESFTTEELLPRRIGRTVIEFVLINNYTLVSIDDGIADFDIAMEYKLKGNPMQYSIQSTGSGKGEMKYNITNNFCEMFEVDQEQDINLQMTNYEVESKTTDFFSRTTEITKQ